MIAQLVSALALALAPDHQLSERTLFAYSPLEVWDSGNIHRLGVRPEAIYLIDGPRSNGEVMRLEKPYLARHATLSPRRDRVAFIGRVGADPIHQVEGAFVVDAAGGFVASFPGAAACVWSPDGATLAVVYARADSAQLDVQGMKLWSENEGIYRTSLWPEEVGWITETLLLARSGPGVAEVDARGRSVASSAKKAVNLSPDRRYSLRRTPGNWKHPIVVVELSGADITPCATASRRPAIEQRSGIVPIGKGDSDTRSLYGKERYRDTWNPDLHLSHWVRLPGADHLLTVTFSTQGGSSIPLPGNCLTAVLDVETGEQIVSVPGYVIGPTVDSRGALVLQPNDSIAILDVQSASAVYRKRAEASRLARKGKKVTMLVELYRSRVWGSMHERIRIRSDRLSVSEGDRLPSYLQDDATCALAFQVEKILSPERVRIRYDGGRWRSAHGSSVETGGSKQGDAAFVTGESQVFLPQWLLVPPNMRADAPPRETWDVSIRTDSDR